MFLAKLFGDENKKYLKKIEPLLEKVNSHEKDFESLELGDFSKKTLEFKERLEKGQSLNQILPEAFALVREASKRTLGQRHYDVQIIGGITLHQGNIAEMRTGEGKTLVATLPVYLNALEGKGVHVITVNDYLARRDAVWMGQIYALLGLSIGVINSQNISFIYDPLHTEENKSEEEKNSFKIIYEHLRPCTRKEAYQADITYGTNHEYGFDYLRDNLVASIGEVTQREHYFAIVDEVDSILIDESRTPLIISSEAGESEEFYVKFSQIARQLEKEIDYKVDEKLKAISLTEEGINRAEELLGVQNIYTEKGIKYVFYLENAVRAYALFHLDKDYVVREGEVIIVDPFTGRLQPGRRWSEGLHQSIEAKEGVDIQKETRTAASITFQNYFKMYKKIGGMTGTAKTSAEEFMKVYGLDVIAIPTHLDIKRKDLNDLIFQTEKGKFQAIAKKVKTLQDKGQPVLIGTISIEKNELLSAYLTQEGVRHIVLNAKNHEKEGEIVAQAGIKSGVTVATNMAGRGVDIKLGGNPCTSEQSEEVKNLGGLFVLGTERHEARRIDNQLRGRAGRQGDPGETQFFVSLEDDLMRVFGAEGIKKMMGRFGVPEDHPVENKFISKVLESAQGKIEGFNFDARKYTLEFDNVINHHRRIIYERRRRMLEGDTRFARELLDKIFKDDEEAQKLIVEKENLVGKENFGETIRRIILYVSNILWAEHLETMDYTRSSVNLRAYGQRDPLIEYRREGLRLFRDMEANLSEQVFTFIQNINVEGKKLPVDEIEGDGRLEEVHQEFEMFENAPDNTGAVKKVVLSPETLAGAGRNDPCPCGAVKEDGTPIKFKHCHGK